MRRPLLLAFCLSLTLFAGNAIADARQAVFDAFQKGMAKGAFSATIESPGQGQSMQMKVILPNRFHMKTPDAEMIIVPGGAWMNAQGQWMKLPVDMSKMIEGFSQKSIEEGMSALQDVREIGNETINGCDSTVYAYRSSGKFMGVDSNNQAEIAVCDRSGTPVRVVTRDAKGVPNATVFYDFDTAFEITEPN